MRLEKHYHLSKAARLLGVGAGTLHVWLVHAGYAPPEQKPGKGRVIVPISAIKRVLAYRAFQRSDSLAARWQVSEEEIAKAHVLLDRLKRIRYGKTRAIEIE